MIKRLRGTKDLFGNEACRWERIEGLFRDTFRRFGFTPMRTPILEETLLFKRSVGEVTDIVQKEMYSFEDRSGQDVSMRPEGTAPIVRAYIENNLQQASSVQKLYYAGPMFRAERPQAGRLRQFHQIGAEVIGADSMYSDVELIEALTEFLKACGISDFGLEINSLGSGENRKKYAISLSEYFEQYKNDLSDDAKNKLDRNVFRLLDSKDKAIQQMIQDAPQIIDYISSEARNKFELIVSLLERMDIPVKVNHRIVRGLDYYTDIVFELKHGALGAQDALAAGGRYDGLVAQLDGPNVPATGFALGLERLMIILDAVEAGADTTHESYLPAVMVIAMGEANRESAYLLASNIRKAGIRAEIELENRSIKASMRLANKKKFRFVIVLGDDEAKANRVTVKDMGQASVQNQDQTDIDQVPSILKEKIKGL
ncbi:MAG: histidyl-tRNA synthetase [Candidatus Omnitrophota bacterium]|jgi:histidyl-tRNA synthetase